jgi:hypothetical protein
MADEREGQGFVRKSGKGLISTHNLVREDKVETAESMQATTEAFVAAAKKPVTPKR